MIIFGTRGVTLTGNSGTFACPDCAGERHYKQRKVRRFFTLYWIPLVPLNLLGEYIECQSCKNTYNDKVLEIDEHIVDQVIESEYERAIRKSMAIMVLADGKIEDSEVTAMTQIYNAITGKDVAEDVMLEEIEETKNEGLDIRTYLKNINGLVNKEGKELVVRALLLIAYADGEFDEEEQKALTDALSEMDISKSDFANIMKNLDDEA